MMPTPDASEIPKPINQWGLWSPKEPGWVSDANDRGFEIFETSDLAVSTAERRVKIPSPWWWTEFYGFVIIVARLGDPTGHVRYRVTRDGVERIEAERPRIPGSLLLDQYQCDGCKCTFYADRSCKDVLRCPCCPVTKSHLILEQRFVITAVDVAEFNESWAKEAAK